MDQLDAGVEMMEVELLDSGGRLIESLGLAPGHLERRIERRPRRLEQ